MAKRRDETENAGGMGSTTVVVHVAADGEIRPGVQRCVRCLEPLPKTGFRPWEYVEVRARGLCFGREYDAVEARGERACEQKEPGRKKLRVEPVRLAVGDRGVMAVG